VREYICDKQRFSKQFSARVLIFAACTDDGHSSIGLSCKVEEGLLHLLQFRRHLLTQARWISVTDDDMFFTVDRLMEFMADTNEYVWRANISDTVVCHYSSTEWNPCAANVNANYTRPLTPSISTHAFISTSLLYRQEPYLERRVIQFFAKTYEHSGIDVAWGMLLYHMQPYYWIDHPQCDARYDVCSSDDVAAHACYGERERDFFTDFSIKTQKECAKLFATFNYSSTTSTQRETTRYMVDNFRYSVFAAAVRDGRNTSEFFMPTDCAAENAEQQPQ